MMQSFKKVYLFRKLTTTINDKNEEKKVVALPKGWNQESFQNEDKGYGYVVVTGKQSGVTVLDADTEEAYEELCKLYPSLRKHYHVKTRRGYHIYFNYNESIISSSNNKIPNVDTRNDNACAYGPGTKIYRPHVKEEFEYKYVGGNILDMPEVLVNICALKNDKEHVCKNDNIDYNYDLTDEEVREVIDKLIDEHPEYMTNYSLWLKFTSCMKSCNKYDLWDEYCKKYTGYNKKKNLQIYEISLPEMPKKLTRYISKAIVYEECPDGH